MITRLVSLAFAIIALILLLRKQFHALDIFSDLTKIYGLFNVSFFGWIQTFFREKFSKPIFDNYIYPQEGFAKEFRVLECMSKCNFWRFFVEFHAM